MTRSWCALPESSLSDVRIAAAGASKFPIFARLIVEAEDAGGGIVPPHRADPRQLAASLSAFVIDADDVQRAISCWESEGVLTKAQDGSIDLRAYVAGASRAQSSSERSRAFRARQRAAAGAGATETNDDVRHVSDGVAQPNGDVRTGNGTVAYLPTHLPTDPPTDRSAAGGAGASGNGKPESDHGAKRALEILRAQRGGGRAHG